MGVISDTGTRWSQSTTAIINQKMLPNPGVSICYELSRRGGQCEEVQSPKIVKNDYGPSDWIIISEEQQELDFSWSSLFPSTSNYTGCIINNSCSTLGQKHDNHHSQSATSVITNSASAECLSTAFSTTWPDYRMHVFVCRAWVRVWILSSMSRQFIIKPFPLFL